MANSVETNEGATAGEFEDEQLEQWLASNNILCAKHKLLQKNVKLHELAEIDPEYAKQYAKDSLGLDEIEANRFAKAIELLSQSNSNNTPMSTSQIIVLSYDANTAIDNLYHKKDEINANITSITKQIDILKQISTQNEQNIFTFKQEIIQKLNERLQHLLRKSNKDITTKINILSDHLNLLQKYNTELKQSESKTNVLLNDTTMNKLQRETEIIKLSKSVSELQIIQPNITPRVKMNINKNIIMDDINKIGEINYIKKTEINPNMVPVSKIKIESMNSAICDNYDTKSIENEKDETKSSEIDLEWKNIYFDSFGIIFKPMDDMNEFWSVLGGHTEISNDKMTITKLSNDYSSTFGNVIIRSISHKVCEWKIKINKLNTYFAIGISSDFSSQNKTFYENTKSSNYAYFNNGRKVSKNKSEKYGKIWRDGDIIGIKLDEIEKYIEFSVNGESQGIAYANIDTSRDIVYKLAVHMYYTHSSVSMIEFAYLS